jgi:hypothetical protein
MSVFRSPYRNELLDEVLDQFVNAFRKRDRERQLVRERRQMRRRRPDQPDAGDSITGPTADGVWGVGSGCTSSHLPSNGGAL